MTLCWDCCHIKTITCSMPSIFQQTKSFLFWALNQKVVNLHFYVVTAWRHIALSAYYFMTWGPNWIEGRTQLWNLWWMLNSVRLGFGTATKTGSSRRFKRYPTTYMWVSSRLPFTVYCGLRLILVYPNPQKRETDLTLTYRLWGIVWIVLMSPFS